MPKIHRSTWQKSEIKAAGFFGAKRNPGSGSQGRDDLSASDSTHPRLFIETKSHARHAARTLFDDVKGKAAKEGKTPVLMLADRGRPGFLVCCHSDDLEVIAREYLAVKVDKI